MLLILKKKVAVTIKFHLFLPEIMPISSSIFVSRIPFGSLTQVAFGNKFFSFMHIMYDMDRNTIEKKMTAYVYDHTLAKSLFRLVTEDQVFHYQLTVTPVVRFHADNRETIWKKFCRKVAILFAGDGGTVNVPAIINDVVLLCVNYMNGIMARSSRKHILGSFTMTLSEPRERLINTIGKFSTKWHQMVCPVFLLKILLSCSAILKSKS